MVADFCFVRDKFVEVRGIQLFPMRNPFAWPPGIGVEMLKFPNALPVIFVMFVSLVLSIPSHAQWKQTGPYGGSVHVLAVSPVAEGGANIYAGMYGGVFLSTDVGAHWRAVNTGLTDTSYIGALAVRGTGLFAATYRSGVFLSTNSGSSWTPVGAGLPTDSYVTSLAVNGTSVFAGSYAGVFVSTNDGANWTTFNNALTNGAVEALACSGSVLMPGRGEVVFSGPQTVRGNLDGGECRAVDHDGTGLRQLTCRLRKYSFRRM